MLPHVCVCVSPPIAMSKRVRLSISSGSSSSSEEEEVGSNDSSSVSHAMKVPVMTMVDIKARLAEIKGRRKRNKRARTDANENVQQAPVDDPMQTDAQGVEDDVQEFMELVDTSSVLPYVASYLLSIAFPGANQLPLLRALVNDFLVLGASMDVPENGLTEFKSAKKVKEEALMRRRTLIELFYEGRDTLAKRGLALPPFQFSWDTCIAFQRHWPDFILELNDFGINKDDAADKYSQLTPSPSFQEIETLRMSQLALARECSNQSSSKYGMVMGMVSMHSADIHIGPELREELAEKVKEVLLSAVVLMPPDTSASSKTRVGKAWADTISLILKLHEDKMLHLCAELVSYIIQHGASNWMRNSAILTPIKEINKRLGAHFPAYLFSYDLRRLTREEFELYGFVGDFDTHLSTVQVRTVIGRRMKNFADLALGKPLQDHQREIAIDMVIQECLPDEIVAQKQAGIRGLLVYAAPGTGKTLLALFVGAFLTFLNRTPKRKTLLLLPPSASAAFLDDSFERFKPGFQPQIFSYDTSKKKYVLQKSAKEKGTPDEVKSTLDEINFFLIQDSAVHSQIPFGFAPLAPGHNKFDLIMAMRQVVNQDWRVFIDESHEYSNRRTFPYLFIRHWLRHRHATFLLTGTAFVKDYYGVLSQLRLLGYQAKWDLSIPLENRDFFKKLDANVPEADLKQIIDAKVNRVTKPKDLKDFTNSEKEMDESIIARYHSVPALRAIRRIHANVIQNVATALAVETELLTQPYGHGAGPLDDYEKLEKVFDFLFADRLENVNEIVQGIESRDIVGDVSTDNEKEEEEGRGKSPAAGDLERFLDDAGLRNLTNFVVEARTLLKTRNYGVDLRVLSKRQVGHLSGRVKNAQNSLEKLATRSSEQEEMVKLLAHVHDYLGRLEVYRPEKYQADKTDDAVADLGLVERMSNLVVDRAKDAASIAAIDKSEKAQIVQLLHHRLPPSRYERVFRRMEEHFAADETNKGVVFSLDKDVMQAFALWLLHRENFRVFRIKDPALQKEDEAAFPDANYVLFYSSTNSNEQRRHYLQDFRDNPRLRLVLSTTALGSTGLNLQEANFLTLLQEFSVDSEYIQTRARLIRLGQTKKVTVVECYSKNTGEILRRAMRYRRRTLAHEFDLLVNSADNKELMKSFSFTKEDNDDIMAAFGTNGTIPRPAAPPAAPRPSSFLDDVLTGANAPRPFVDLVNDALANSSAPRASSSLNPPPPPPRPSSFLDEVIGASNNPRPSSFLDEVIGASKNPRPAVQPRSSQTIQIDSSSSDSMQDYQPVGPAKDKGKEPERKKKRPALIDLVDIED